MKKILSVLLAAALILSLLAACGANSDPAAGRTDPPAGPTQTQTPSGSDDEQNPPDGGGEEDSWKTAFESAGYEVECVIKGLGELEAIQQLFVQHAQAAVDSLAK